MWWHRGVGRVEGMGVGRVADKVVDMVGVGVVDGRHGEQLGERGGFSGVGLVDCRGVGRVVGEQEPIGE